MFEKAYFALFILTNLAKEFNSSHGQWAYADVSVFINCGDIMNVTFNIMPSDEEAREEVPAWAEIKFDSDLGIFQSRICREYETNWLDDPEGALEAVFVAEEVLKGFMISGDKVLQKMWENQ